jgi:hypothetical protein
MGDYVGTFGITRIVGRGEGRDELYQVSAKPSCGVHKFIEVIVDENGPVANVGNEFGRDGAYIPAGAVVVNAVLLTEVKGSAANVTVSLVKKDGSDSKELLAATTPAGDNTSAAASGDVIGVRLSEDRYFTSAGTKTGLVAKLLVEYI